MKFQRQWYSWILTACCFCLMLTVFSSTALAAESADAINFAEAYGIEIADGSSVEVKFVFPSFEITFDIYKDSSIDDVVEHLNMMTSAFSYTISYDKVSGQLVAMRHGQVVDLKILLDGEELTIKPSIPDPIDPSAPAAPSTMSEMLSTISTVLTVSLSWMTLVTDKIVSNPILLIVVILSFLGTGVLLFKRLLNL